MSSLPVERAFVSEPERPAPGRSARPLVSGRLELEFAADAEARSYLRRQYASYPFHVCRAQFQDRDLPGLPTLYIQSCAGGVYEDDRLELALAMREKAEAHVSTQSATIVHGMPNGTAKQGTRIHCDRGAYLEFLPDPQILFPGSRYQSVTRIRLGEAATCVVSDAFLRHDPEGRGEMFSAYSSEIAIENASGETMAIDRLKIDGTSRPSCPGILGAYEAQGTLVVAGTDRLPSGLRDELQKIRFDRGEAAIGFTQLPKSAGVLGPHPRCRWRGAQARHARDVVRGASCVERLTSPGTAQMSPIRPSATRHGHQRLSTVQPSLNAKVSMLVAFEAKSASQG